MIELIDAVETHHGAALRWQRWNLVCDTCGYVEDSAYPTSTEAESSAAAFGWDVTAHPVIRCDECVDLNRLPEPVE